MAASPRDQVRFLNARYKNETFEAGSGLVYDATKVGNCAVAGRAVTMLGQADNTVDLAGDGDPVAGKLILMDSPTKAVIQVTGNCELPGGVSATLTIGQRFVGALGGVGGTEKGFIKTGAAGSSAAAQAARGEIINNDVTTAVVVALDR